MITIVEVSNRSLLKKFVRFPVYLYAKDPYYVPKLFIDEYHTLREDINPAFDHCDAKYWLAYKDDRIVGRIAAIINKSYIEKWKRPYGRFGYVDFIDDGSVAQALFQTAESWLLANGMSHIHGPLGFCDLDPEGMLVEGFGQISTFTTTYNHPYYPEFMKNLGYVKDVDWLEYELTVPKEVPPTVKKLAQWAMKKYRLYIPDINRKKDLIPYIPAIFDLINRSYDHLYAVTELSKKQIEYFTKQYIALFSVDFVKLILNENDDLVAFGLALPSLSKAMQKNRGRLFPIGFLSILGALRKNDRAELLLIGVDPAYQGKGVNAILLNQIVLDNPMKIQKADLNPQLENNTPVQSQWKNYTVKQNRRRRCYIKKLRREE
ncbi:GNAT family N-acetyltransferase [Alkalibacter rhizosphaerae]|uniref:GNAT family N-acetyltransferase n=1 Tax=Alkalibacter rhizosphaerae TaxID=2815577 RepID=A0A974XLW6_9FIRM|nr:GNAT family N-acetyltransferase [Alkalibacter rhizosphaerae]QSX08356.1 GNAT family N-acetyltransferase [Alkalibacter rhizosphaerae]